MIPRKMTHRDRTDRAAGIRNDHRSRKSVGNLKSVTTQVGRIRVNAVNPSAPLPRAGAARTAG